MILWIDPWCRKCGYALIEKNSTWLTIVDAWIFLQEQKKDDRVLDFQRMYEMFQVLKKQIETNNVQCIWIEKLFFTRFNQDNAEFVYWLRGLIIGYCVEKSIPFYEYTPTQLKKAITWNWKAIKSVMQSAIMRLYRLQHFPEFDDAADALALAFLASRY